MRSCTHHPAQDLKALGEPAPGRASLRCVHTAALVPHGGHTRQGESTDGQFPFRSGGRRPLPLLRGSQRPQALSPLGAAATSPQGHAAARRDQGCGRCRCSRFPLPEMASQGRAGPAAVTARPGPTAEETCCGATPGRPPASPRCESLAPRALTELVLCGRGHVAGWGGRGGGVRRSAPPTPPQHRHRAGGRLSPPPSPPLPPPPPPPSPPRPAPCGSCRQWQRPLFCHRQYIFRESRRPNRPPPSRTQPGPAATAPPDGP